MSNLTIKIQHCQDIRRVSVPKETTYSELLKITKGLFKLVSRTDWSNLSMKYTDTEDDMITISNTEDLREAFSSHKFASLKIILNFDARELFGYRALISQFSEDYPGHTHTTFFVNPISAKDKISPKEFENAKKVLTSHMVNFKQPQCTPHVTVRYLSLFSCVFIDELAQVLTFSNESINRNDFHRAKNCLNSFIFDKKKPITKPTTITTKTVQHRNLVLCELNNLNRKPIESYQLMDPICFENAKRVTAEHVDRHIQLQKSLKITPYAALYIEPSKRVDYSKTPLIKYAFAPKNTKSNETNEKKITPTQTSRKPTIAVSRPEIIKSACFQKVKENYRLMDPICFENAKRVTAKHVDRHIQLQKSLKITPYAALYIEPSKRVDYSKTPLIEYAFAPKNTKSNETSEKKIVVTERELSILNRMGFHDNQKNIETLKKTNGNLSDAVEYLLSVQ